MKKLNNTLSSTLAALIATAVSACSGVPEETSNAPVLLEAEPVMLTDLAGEPLTVVLQPNSTVEAGGDARYVVSAGNRELEISRTVAPGGSEYLEALEGGVLLGALELERDSITLRAADGAFLFTTTGELPAEQATSLVEPLALTLLDQTTLERFDAVLQGPGPESELGVARQGLRINVSGSCSVECSNWGTPKVATCCCAVGQRCRSLLDTCVCEDASRPLTNSAIFGGGTGIGVQLLAQ